MDDYWHRNWACPYYVRSGRHTVECEFGGRVHLPDDHAAKAFFSAYCANLPDWQRCSVAQALERHYAGKE